MDNPAWCKKGSDNEYAKVFPLDKSPRQAAVLDPKTKKYKFIDTCFGTHHPQFGYDADNTLWISGTGPVAGWINTKVFDETDDAQKAVGWSPFVLDTNGNGKLDEFGEQAGGGQGHCASIAGSGPYAVMPHPTDGSIWYTSGTFGGRAGFLRFDPKTKLSEFYELPKEAIGVRGGDIDPDGVVYGSGSARPSDRVRPQQVQGPLNGPNATGNHCPEGFTLTKYPGPGFADVPNSSAEASYYTWVDHHDAVGLGKNVPISTANLQDGFVALVNGKMVLMKRAVSDGLLRQGPRRPHRRSERRLEGQGPVERLRRPHALAQRARQGRLSDGGAHPGAARSAGALRTTSDSKINVGAATRAAPTHIPTGFGDGRRMT